MKLWASRLLSLGSAEMSARCPNAIGKIGVLLSFSSGGLSLEPQRSGKPPSPCSCRTMVRKGFISPLDLVLLSPLFRALISLEDRVSFRRTPDANAIPILLFEGASRWTSTADHGVRIQVFSIFWQRSCLLFALVRSNTFFPWSPFPLPKGGRCGPSQSFLPLLITFHPPLLTSFSEERPIPPSLFL